jgi:16S rRNA (uracil1498-N3)-methyltransferase
VSRPELERRVAALAQFRVDHPGQPVLDRDDAHHLFRVLRARQGEEVVVTDGSGRFAFASVAANGVERTSELFVDPPLARAELYLSPLKGDHSERAVARAVELGVTRVVPLMAERVVAAWRGDAGAKHLRRWRRIAEEAAGQCRRTFDMIVDEPVAVGAVPGDVAVCDIGGDGDLSGVTGLAIGPEGGWSSGEWSDERVRVGLGEVLLRADTAAVVAATMLVSHGEGWSRRAVGGAER